MNAILTEKLVEKGVEANAATKIAAVIVNSKAGKKVSAEQADLVAAFEKDSNIISAVNEVFTDPAAEKSTAKVDGVKYSIKRTQHMTWEDQINGALSHNKQIKHSDTLVLDDTPGALVNDGVEGKKLAIPLSVITKAKSGKDVSHSITDENLKDLQRGVRSAPIVINNPARNALVFVTDIRQDGAPVLAAFKKDAQFDGDDVHKATSIHLQMDVASMLKALPADATVYVKNESELDAAVGIADSLRSISAIIKFTGDTITQPVTGVNGKVVTDEVESAEGKVLRGNTAVEIAGVVDAGGGKLQVKLSDGSTADVSELSFPDNGEAELWRVLTEYSGDAASAQQLLEEYHNSGLDANRFARGVEEGFLFGSVNMSPKEMNRRGNYVYMLSKAQRDMVYQMGKSRGDLQAQQRDQEARAGRDTEGVATESAGPRNDRTIRTGAVHYGYEGQQMDKSRLKATQKVGVHFAEKLARKKGMTFYFFESFEENGVRVFKNAQGETVELKENGWYDPSDGSIHIDLNCGDMGSTVLYTIAHELTHFVKDMSAVKYRTLCSIVTEGFLDHGQSVQELVKNKQKDYAALGQELTWEEAYDEVIASAMEGIINDGQVMDLLDEIETKDKNLFDQVVSFLQDVADLIWETIHAYRDVKPESPEGSMVTRMKGVHAQLQQAFAEALHDAGENFREGAKINTANQGRESIKSIRTTEDGITYVKLDGDIFLRADGTEMSQSEAYNTLLGKKITLEDGDVITFIKNLPKRSVYNELFKKLPGYDPGIDVKAVSQAINKNIVEVIAASSVQTRNEKQRHPHIGIKDFDQREVYLADDNSSYRLELCIANLTDGTKIAYVKRFISNTNVDVAAKIKKAETTVQNRLNQPSKTTIRNSKQKVNKNSATNSPKSLRYQKNQAAQAHVAQQNSSLEEDVQALNQLTAEQRKRGNAGKLQRSALDAAASFLMKTAGAKGDKGQLVQILDRFYTYVGTTENTHWEDVREQALPVVRWLMDNTVRSQQHSFLVVIDVGA